LRYGGRKQIVKEQLGASSNTAGGVAVRLLAKIALFALTIGASIFAYRNVLYAGFASDDLSIWLNIATDQPFNDFTYGSLGATFFRPMVPVLLYVTHQFVGLDPFAFHLLNVIVHGLTAGVLFFAAREASTLFGSSARAHWPVAGAVASLLFIFLRTHAEAVNWLSAIGDVMSTFCVVVSFYFYLVFRNQGKVPSLKLFRALNRIAVNDSVDDCRMRLTGRAIGRWLRGPRPRTRCGQRRDTWANAIKVVLIAVAATASVAMGFAFYALGLVLVVLLLGAGGQSWSALGRALFFFGLALLFKEAAIGFLLVVFFLEWLRVPVIAIPVGLLALIFKGVMESAIGAAADLAIILLLLFAGCSFIHAWQSGNRREALGLPALGVLLPFALFIAVIGHGLVALFRFGCDVAGWLKPFVSDYRGALSDQRLKRQHTDTQPNLMVRAFGRLVDLLSEEVRGDEGLLGLWRWYRPRIARSGQQALRHYGPVIVFGIVFLLYWRLRREALGPSPTLGGWGQFHTQFDLAWLRQTLPLHFNNASLGLPTEWPFWFILPVLVAVLPVAFWLRWRVSRAVIPVLAYAGIPLTLACLVPAMPLPVGHFGDNSRFAYMPSAFFAIGFGFAVSYVLPRLPALFVGIGLVVPHYLALQVENLRWRESGDIVRSVYAQLSSPEYQRARRLYVLSVVDFYPGEHSIEGAPQIFKAAFASGFYLFHRNATAKVGVATLLVHHRRADRVNILRGADHVYEITSMPHRQIAPPALFGKHGEVQQAIVAPGAEEFFRVLRVQGRSIEVELLDYDPQSDQVIYVDHDRVLKAP
jgi:hypothetical protein